jgi:hypothetical protein
MLLQPPPLLQKKQLLLLFNRMSLLRLPLLQSVTEEMVLPLSFQKAYKRVRKSFSYNYA